MCIISKLQRIKQAQAEKKLLKALRSHGVPQSQVQEIKEEFDRKPKKGTNYFVYQGPNDEKTRPFCKAMLKLDKVWSEDEIAIISIELGYDVTESNSTFGPGAYNCRHKWRKFRGEFILVPPPTIGQIKRIIDKGIKVN